MCAASCVLALFGISTGPLFCFLSLVLSLAVESDNSSSPPRRSKDGHSLAKLSGRVFLCFTSFLPTAVDFASSATHVAAFCMLAIRLRIQPRAFLSPCTPLSFYSTSGSVLLPFLDAYVCMSGSLIMQSLSFFLILPQRPRARNPPPYPNVHSVDTEVGHFM
jgi:hypothetical protein